MSNNVIVKYRDGTLRKFEDRGRAGGSYTQSVEYGPGHVTIVDVWGARTSIPLDLIEEIQECPTRHY